MQTVTEPNQTKQPKLTLFPGCEVQNSTQEKTVLVGNKK